MADIESFQPSDFGRYRLEERLAVGGMAEIFRAKSFGVHGFEKTLVIKRILPRLSEDAEFVELFIDEARVMTRLNHPKVVQVQDFGEVDGQYFIAMEYVEGLDLLELLRTCAKRRVRPTTAIAVHVIAEVLDALDFAHNMRGETGQLLGIVHADVSPSNIFISSQGEVKLGDFGIARARGTQTRPESGALRGKYGYMSPEQVSGGRLDGRADIFAVGIVMAELLMIRRLFIAQNDLEVLLQVRDARLDRLQKFGKRIPADLMGILESALVRDPNLRYQTAGMFRDALHRYLFENRRMVRSTDVRRFLSRLRDTGRPLDLSPEPLRAATGRHRISVSEMVPTGDEHKVVDLDGEQTTPPLEAGPTKEAPPHIQSVLVDGTLDGEETTPKPELFPEGRSVVGRKRRIQLEPPPAPKPVPQGLPQTGEEPRLTTHQALAAMPELGAPGSSLGDFRTPDLRDGGPPPLPSDLDRIESSGEPESVAARLTTPIAGVPQMASPSLKGDLQRTSLFGVMFSLAMQEATGLLVLRRDEAVKEIYLVDGHPHYVSSNQAEELFGQYLVRKGAISQGELSMALAMLPHFSGKLGDTLVALKLMRPMQVLRHLTHQVREKLLDTFNWAAGAYLFYQDKESASESAPLGLDAYELLGAGANRISISTVRERLQPHLSKRPRATMPPPVPPEVFRLGSVPRETFDKLNGQATLKDLLSRFDEGAQREAFERVAFLLIETKLAH